MVQLGRLLQQIHEGNLQMLTVQKRDEPSNTLAWPKGTTSPRRVTLFEWKLGLTFTKASLPPL